MMWSVWTIAPAAALAASAALIAWAWRGRRVDDHPVCRRCGFDLFGKPDGSAICSECGADLNRRRAVRVGNRVARRRTMTLAVLVLLCAGGWLGVTGWHAARGTDWDRHKPVWWLAREAGGKDAARRDAALAELVRRVRARKISDGQLADLTDRALAHQGDSSQPWVIGWGQLVEAAEVTGRLPPEKWERYALNGFPLRMRVRPRIRRGDPIPVEYEPDPPRVASFRLQARLDPAPALHLGTGVIPDAKCGTGGMFSSGLPIGNRRSWSARTPYGGWQTYEWPTKVAATLPDGPQTATLHYRLKVTDRVPLSPFVDADRTVTAAWQLLPSGTPSTILVTDPAHRPAMTGAFVGQSTSIAVDANGRAACALRFGPLPVAVAFDVVIRQGQREWPAGSYVRAADPPARPATPPAAAPMIRRWPYDLQAKCLDLAAGRADIVLRPSTNAAAPTLDVTAVWGEEIVIKDVLVTRP